MGAATCCKSGSCGSSLVTRAGSVSCEGTSCRGGGLNANGFVNESSDTSVGVTKCCEEGVVCLGTGAGSVSL